MPQLDMESLFSFSYLLFTWSCLKTDLLNGISVCYKSGIPFVPRVYARSNKSWTVFASTE